MISKIYSGIEVKFKEEDLNKKGVIYCLTFENGKTYVGQTVNELHKRISQHCYITNGCTKLKNAIQKYKSFSLSILESNLTISQLNSFEQFYIKLFNSNGIDGYNLDSGGLNKTLSDETKSKMSESRKGRNFSDETKRKISETEKGKTISDETRSRMSDSHKGKTPSDEAKSKMSESSKGKNSKKVKSIPDNIIFDSTKKCATYYNISNIELYYNGKFHRRSGQTFVLL